MSQQAINIGTSAGDGTGDPGRTAFTKVNANFSELYARSVLGSSVSDAAPGASANDYAPAGYTAGTTNRLLVTAAAGGTALTGLEAPGVDGFQLLLVNASDTDQIVFSHQDAGSLAANRFNCPSAVAAVLQPLASALLCYVTGLGWVFL